MNRHRRYQIARGVLYTVAVLGGLSFGRVTLDGDIPKACIVLLCAVWLPMLLAEKLINTEEGL
jgi:hypothetical protein